MNPIEGKNILVTGGAGFIGSWVVDKIVLHKPKKIVVVDNFFLGKIENLNEAKNRMNNNLKVSNCDATSYESLKKSCEKSVRYQ